MNNEKFDIFLEKKLKLFMKNWEKSKNFKIDQHFDTLSFVVSELHPNSSQQKWPIAALKNSRKIYFVSTPRCQGVPFTEKPHEKIT